MDFFQSQVSAQSGFDFIPSFFEGLGEKTHIFRIIIYNQYAAMLGVVDNDLNVIYYENTWYLRYQYKEL